MLGLLALAAASVAQPLAPTGKWIVRYDNDMCVLARSYGDENNPIALAIHAYPMGTTTEIVLIDHGRKVAYETGKAGFTLLPSNHAVTGTYVRYTTKDRSTRFSRLSLDQSALDGLEIATAVIIQFGKEDGETFAVPAMPAAIRALRVCQADLLKSWGIDVSEQQSVVTLPKANLVSFLQPSDYPAQALKASEQGRVITVLSISVSGTVDACAVVSSSHSQSLDDVTCKVLRRGRFTPGRDKDGKAVPSHLVVPIRWSLPGG